MSYAFKYKARRLAVITAGLFVLAGSAAGIDSALASPGTSGPVVVTSQLPGPYYTGDLNVCVNPRTFQLYAQAHTLTPGNCAHNWIQGTLRLYPQDIAPSASPTASPSASPTATPSASSTVTPTATPTATATEG